VALRLRRPPARSLLAAPLAGAGVLAARRHLPGAREPAAARRRRERAERRTWALAVVAILTGGGVAGAEVARVARLRGKRPGARPLPPPPAAAALADTAVAQTVEVALEGYRGGTQREHALVNLLVSYSTTWALVRVSTHAIRRRGTWGPFRNVVVRRQHIHHFVPGIALAFLAGGASVLSRSEDLDPWFAVPFGAGVALTLDESALLLKLDDVYWTEEGIVSVQVGFATIVLLSTLALVLRVLRRGEQAVLEPPPGHEGAQGLP
jgi:hypothetical protein